ncbi:MAG TPA: hypothetical protein PKL89_01815 [Coprothermobacter proteolyticus]|uniref:hypothetical protein n=1 Tax=Coprothermobacter proteolyticus TaxID=35786 RepID=UPI000D312B72|nr:hypothetical protein [Coprothermobacter proteolyticus]NLT83412.1 hypothetical protein [Coprothermobacter proteolyticus]HOA64572.1 hypothetical protein [Coprothermobacter proteolyticus]HOK24280.1 hypothetical protein [Coprothermobacter proteolyticus]HOL53036.1 hypothetical protein [Coprothermobacter proteolyticus]HOP45493.1 hypothetical protein [Coprothermobacter proteolyticus]
MKQVTLEELERITGLPRYAVVVAVGLTAKKIQKEVLSHSPTYEVPVERAIQDIAERKVTVTLRI